MSGLQKLKQRIKSAKSTQKITKAMKMVAAAKLKKVRDKAEATERYANKMAEMVSDISKHVGRNSDDFPLLAGTGKNQTHLLVVGASDRGLCGGFNSSIVKKAKSHIAGLLAEKKTVKIICIGKKSFDQLKSLYLENIVHRIDGITKKPLTYDIIEDIAKYVLDGYEKGEFDICTIFYSKFVSAISQIPQAQQIIPQDSGSANDNKSDESEAILNLSYEYEPNPEDIISKILPLNIKTQIYQALLENAASEQGARVTAMDNATRNAGDMIAKITLEYNRKRQAGITKELIEIISGAEAI